MNPPLCAARPSVLPSALVAPLDDNQRLVEMVAEILHQPLEEVRRLLYAEEMYVGAYHASDHSRQWNLEPNVWSDKLPDFYRRNHVGVIGNPAWNRRAEKLKLRQWMGEYLARTSDGPLDVLTVGDGSGFDSLYLALCGHRVAYSEENEPCIAFARKLFASQGAPVRIVEKLEAEPRAAFDVVVCLDVIEHVPDPPDFVAFLASHLRPSGRLIVHAPFFFADRYNPTHLAANRKYSGDLRTLYAANGLALVDGRFFWDPIVLEKRAGGRRPRGSRPLWCLALRCAGLLLAVGRWWNWPHTRIAIRAMQHHNPRWLKGLEGPSSCCQDR